MSSRSGLVLYVDDEKSNRVVFEASFSDEFSVMAVSSGREALKTMEGTPVAVIVTDQRMPEMTGIDLLAKVKARHPAVIRIVLTAYPDLNPVLRAVNEHLVHRYIQKPFEQGDLRETLRWALSTYDLAKEGMALQSRVVETERLITLGGLQATIIHDLRSPLSYVRYSVQSLAQLQSSIEDLRAIVERHGDEVGPERQKQLTKLFDQAPVLIADMQYGTKQLSGMIASIERLMKPRRGDEQIEPADPLPAIRFAVSVGQYLANEARRSKVYYDGPSSLPMVAIGETELMQVMTNLVTNGVHALIERGEPDGQVRVTAKPSESTVRITVVDTGPGMSRETLEQLGNTFFSRRKGGTGIGVSQCYRLLGAVGGTLEYESSEGIGTTAIVTLPRS